jgi:glyoxylase I family protein
MPEVTGIDHIYICVSDLQQSESFYDRVFLKTLGFRKNTFTLNNAPHIQYYNRLFGYVIRPMTTSSSAVPGNIGLHHFCLRVDSIEDVKTAADQLRVLGIDASPAEHCPEYAPDYWATYFSDPDSIALEITNYRQERRERHDHWPA